MFNERRIRSKMDLFKAKYLTIKYLGGITITFLAVFLLLVAGIYYTVYEGYRQKLITAPEAIPEELDTVVLVSDRVEDNLSFLIDEVEQLYLARKFIALHIFILDRGDDVLTNEIVSEKISLVNPNLYTLDLQTLSLEEVCITTSEQYGSDRFAIVSFEEYALRTNFLCNNLGSFSVAYTPEVVNPELIVPNDSLPTKVKEVIGKIFNIQI